MDQYDVLIMATNSAIQVVASNVKDKKYIKYIQWLSAYVDRNNLENVSVESFVSMIRSWVLICRAIFYDSSVHPAETCVHMCGQRFVSTFARGPEQMTEIREIIKIDLSVGTLTLVRTVFSGLLAWKEGVFTTSNSLLPNT